MKLHDLIVAANRLPIRQTLDSDGNLIWSTSPGGLASALTPVMQKADSVVWVGWPGSNAEKGLERFSSDGIDLIPVNMSAQEIEAHYEGMSNGTLWPLYHDKVINAVFHRRWFDAYKKINERFAHAIAPVVSEDSTIWINDYQLQLVPKMIRAEKSQARIGFFLHTPFPPPELFKQLPWREEIIRGLLGCNLIGMQTPNDADNFYLTVEDLGLGHIEGSVLHHAKGTTEINAFPIGIDFETYAQGGQSAETAARATQIRDLLGNPKTVILGVDRLDYTKGIETRMRAYKELLEDSRLDPSSVALIQVATPSRNNVRAYERIRSEVEQAVGNINGRFAELGRLPIHYLGQDQNFEELLGLYRASDIMLVTPYKDGMNLVAMEYAATRYDNTGSLILSEFAGAAHVCDGALKVNPYAIDELKEAILTAVKMPQEAQARRMEILRNSVKNNDVNQWAEAFVGALSKAD